MVPPDEYLPRARELCTRYCALLIADEIQTGMGRTGNLWGVDHWNVAPDIMCVGKSIGGGVMPLAAFISTPAIWEVSVPNPVVHSTPFGGNRDFQRLFQGQPVANWMAPRTGNIRG